MNLFFCNCGWCYVVGRRKVYGPIYEDASVRRMMSREEFRDGYADCDGAYNYANPKKKKHK